MTKGQAIVNLIFCLEKRNAVKKMDDKVFKDLLDGEIKFKEGVIDEFVKKTDELNEAIDKLQGSIETILNFTNVDANLN